MAFWKEHPALRIVLIAVLFVLAITLVIVGWTMTGELAGLGIMILGVALLLAALDTVRGWRKLPVFAVGGLCAWQCFYLVTVEQHPAWMFTSASRNVTIALAAVLAVLTVWWAVRSIRRGETC